MTDRLTTWDMALALGNTVAVTRQGRGAFLRSPRIYSADEVARIATAAGRAMSGDEVCAALRRVRAHVATDGATEYRQEALTP